MKKNLKKFWQKGKCFRIQKNLSSLFKFENPNIMRGISLSFLLLLSFMFSQHIFYCHLGLSVSAFLAPETVEDPKNQTVVAGFNVTLNCTAKGSPMPSITWIKNNDPLAIQSNPRIKYIQTALDDKKIHSQLVIKDAKKEDKGKYHCVANNTAGEKASDPAFLSIEDLGETYAVYYFLTWHQG